MLFSHLIFKTLLDYGIKQKASNGIVDINYEDLLEMRRTDEPINPSDYDDNPIDLKTDDIEFGFEPPVGPLPDSGKSKPSSNQVRTQLEQQADKIISHLIVFNQPFTINPQQFVAFKKKADVCCACPADKACFALPYRRFCFSTEKTTSPHGSMFMSSVMNYFLNPYPKDNNAKKLSEHLQEEFHKLKEHFIPMVYEQNKIDPNDPNGCAQDHIA